VYLGTFSKSIAPSIRISYMVLPKALVPVYQRQAACFSTTVSRLDQRVLEQFIRQGHFERHLNHMRSIYKTKHDALVEAVRQQAPEMNIRGENAGLHILLELPEGEDPREYKARAAGAGIRIYCLSEYAMTGEALKKDCLLLGYGTLPGDKLESAVRALFTAFNQKDS
jgi:GntR family transcriptional regulator/MocR family aminotransferase